MTAKLELTLARTECYGTCPVYKVSVDANNKIVFEGIKHTKVEGKAEDILAIEKKEQLITAINQAGFFSLRDSYADRPDCPSMATDHPTVNVSITLDGKSKSIRHYLGCKEDKEPRGTFPVKLYDLENEIDRIIGTSRWIKADK